MEKNSIFNEDPTFQNLVRTAKRKSLKRIILISFSVTVSIALLVYAFIALGQYFMYKEMDKQSTLNYLESTFTGANLQVNSTSYDHFFLAGNTKSPIYKNVNGHEVNWGIREHFYTILGTKAPVNNSHSSNGYRNNQRVLKFYPYTESKIEDDLDYLKTLPPFYSVEVGLSFTKELTIDEMASKFPTAQWAWILQNGLLESIDEQKKEARKWEKQLAEQQQETNVDLSKMPKMNYGLVSGDSAYGFQILNNPVITNEPFHSAESFLDQVDMYAHDEKEALNILRKKMETRDKDTTGLNIRNHEKMYEAELLKATIGDVDGHSLKVGGVVLTGTLEEVLPYLENDIVHYVSAGVILPY
ncbi:sigma factor regulator N-terminal domain-containing protein [Lysinibacillus sp. NPDC096418]|uniref:sigma factor regulator N-terminal domain-containing protein n=1 Tax=Lysinibacillus sp. NPDC096418 TaxID=3364138 RepID=UPI0037F3DE93